MKRTLIVLIAALAIGASGTAAASASASVVPRQGSYSGHDNHGNKVTFRYSGTSGMTQFSIESHLSGGAAHISGAHWSQTCSDRYCTSGSWSNSTTAQGHYFNTRTQHSSFWTAHWQSRPGGGVTH